MKDPGNEVEFSGSDERGSVLGNTPFPKERRGAFLIKIVVLCRWEMKLFFFFIK